MKNPFLTVGVVSLIILSSCNSNSKKAESKDSVETFTMKNASCFRAISNTDTATLNYDQNGKKVVGELTFKFKDKENTSGTVIGEFKGDTLFVDYTFKLKGTEYKNPQVFLMQGNNLLQGAGELEVYVGRTYFKKSVPIIFKNGFVFEPADCK
ncbi:hypothetical protein A5893_06195 [Pedobacter psychrophilus]|uniref:Lipoprotein n=1 Tax=Pedobacter psychrophilus TaxID=1826909 RepID=A0A179DHI5_9SPHI|nr:hypothetical protein [Pedobacter psychrophilus]OAQ40536.1 hypothetical protein A5893_06195 [Pedobacter psychrophilus]